MSIWTHVNASFRLDGYGYISDKEIEKIFGKQVSYEDLSQYYGKKHKVKTLPMGSEGSLEMTIWHNPDECCVASTTVFVFGDLRDYDSFSELEKWFNEVCKNIRNSRIICGIRQAVMQVSIENNGSKTFQVDYDY